MGYITFARKYRPQIFSEIIGQSHITKTLENAISQDRVSHAYIFAGGRGIGKTTTARILAKAVNCEKGKDGPCNKCSSCLEITHGSSMDVLEIDGASNRGIDEIRNLRDNIKFAPSKGAYKIYIIDEVHMLTQEAFNALLKTLEEPPPHVKFIFATTQAYKVPPTILSRCQRFDFKRISVKDIAANLKNIVKAEKLKVKDDALNLIAKYADGSMRDAEVILDQMTAFTKGDIGIKDVIKILGVVDEDILFGLSSAIKDKNPKEALIIVDGLVNEGKDIIQIVTNLIEHFRNMSIVKMGRDLDHIIDTTPENLKRYEDEAGNFSVEEILYVMYTLSGTIDFVRKTNMSKIPLEAALIKLSRRAASMGLNDVLKKLDEIVAAGSTSRNSFNEDVPVSAPHSASDNVTQSDPAQSVPDNEFPPDTANNKESTQRHSSAGDIVLGDIVGAWSRVLGIVKNKKISVGMYLDEGYPEGVSSNVVTVAFPKSSQFHREALESQDYKQIIEDAIKEVVGAVVRVKFIESGADNPLKPSQLQGSTASVQGMQRRHKEIDPIIKDALDIFEGELNDYEKGGQE